jgi:hypothetical protein
MHFGYMHAPATLIVREESPGMHWAGDLMGCRTCLDVVGKRNLCRESNPGR